MMSRVFKELDNLYDYLSSAGLKKESSELKVVIAQSQSLTYEPLPEEPADTSSVTCSKEANGRKVEVIDRTVWTDDLANSVTSNFVGAEWGKKHFASGICLRLMPILTMGEYGDAMTMELNEAWRSLQEPIIMAFHKGNDGLMPDTLNEGQRSEIVGRAANLFAGGLDIVNNRLSLNFEIKFTKIYKEPEMQV